MFRVLLQDLESEYWRGWRRTPSANLLRDWTTIEGPLKTKLLEEQKWLKEIAQKKANRLQLLREQEDKHVQQLFETLKAAEQKFVHQLEEMKEQRENQISAKLAVLERSLAEITMQSQTLQMALSHQNAEQWLNIENGVRKEFGKWTWDEKPECEFQFDIQLPSLSFMIIETTDYQDLQAKYVGAD